MENKIHTGFIPPEQIETREEGAEHVLGSSGFAGKVINPIGDWTPYRSEGERQNRGFETNACTVFNSLERIEMLIFKATGVRVNYSERYVANLAVMKGILDPHSGANVHTVLELIRTTSGLLNEDKLPWDDNYYTVDQSLMADLLKAGPEWYKYWTLKHVWLWTGNPTPAQKRVIIQDALTKGAVGVSVYAWIQGGDGYYVKPQGAVDGHWTGIDKATGTEPYECSDSYEPFAKKLDPFFDFGFGKLYYIEKALYKYTFLNNLKFGMTTPEVADLQKALISLGYEIPHAVSYYFGPETRKALWQFQVSEGIADDGSNFGPKSRYALNAALNPTRTVFGDIVIFIRSLLGL